MKLYCYFFQVVILFGLLTGFRLLNDPLWAQSVKCPEMVVENGQNNVHFNCTQAQGCLLPTAQLPDIRQTNAYLVSSVPFSNAYSFNLSNANKILVNTDDTYSEVIPLPFEFCFFGNKFTSMVVSANGTISFDPSYANSPSGWELCVLNTPLSLPNTYFTFPRSGIFASFHDTDPTVAHSNASIEWQVVGEYPCRKMIVNWRDMPLYACEEKTSTFQCVLYENTNVIEIFVKEKPDCSTWNCGLTAIGIQNHNRNQAVTPPGRNTGNWSVSTGEGWQFIPNGPSLLAGGQVKLLNEAGQLLEAVVNPPAANGILTAKFTKPVCVESATSPLKLYVEADYMPCSGQSLKVRDSIVLTIESSPLPPVADTLIRYCQNQPAAPLTANGRNLLWYTAVNGVGSSSAPVPNTAVAGKITYYVTQTIDSCTSNFLPIIVEVLPIRYDTVRVEICSGSSYNYRGATYTTAHTQVDTFTAASGCDSIIYFQLTVLPPKVYPLSVNICLGESFVFKGQTYTQSISGVTDTFKDVKGCDSIVSLTLNVLPFLSGVLDTMICRGETIWFNDVPYNAPVSLSDNVTDTFPSSGGCDSIVSLVIRYRPPVFTSYDTFICHGQSLLFNGNWYNTSTNLSTDTFLTSQGCDSVVRLNLVVLPLIQSTLSVSICQGDSYTFNEQTYTASNNTATDTFTSARGCDSIVRLNLTVKSPIQFNLYDTLCAGDSFVFNNITYKTSQNGTPHNFKTLSGCDSIVKLYLYFRSDTKFDLDTTICSGQSFLFNEQLYTQSVSGVSATFPSKYGCDSIVVLNLNVLKPDTVNIFDTICSGKTYPWGGQNFTTSTTVTQLFEGQEKCDSIVRLHLFVTPYPTGVHQVVICQGTSYEFNGNSYNSNNNTATDTLQTLWGCDSIVRLDLRVEPFIYGVLDTSICVGESIVFNGKSYDTTVTFAHQVTDTFKSYMDCDSIVQLQLTISPLFTRNVYDTICAGQVYRHKGKEYRTTQTITDTVYNRKICDSLIFTYLEVLAYPVGVFDTTICQGMSIIFNGKQYDTTVTFAHGVTDTLTDPLGCDSVVYLTLTISKAFEQMVFDTICSGEVYALDGKIYHNSQQNIRLVWTDANGCDSTIIANLEVLHPKYMVIDTAICEGSQVVFNGKNYTTDVLLRDSVSEVYTAASGCDSIVLLSLKIIPKVFAQEEVWLCNEDLPYAWNGMSVYSLGDSVATFVTTAIQTGCDSVVWLNLHTAIRPTTIQIDSANCGNVFFEGADYTTSVAWTDTFKSWTGCDSLYRMVNISVWEENPQQEFVPVFGCGEVLFEGIIYNASTQWIDTFYSQYGCDSIYRTVEIEVEHFELELSATPDSVLYYNESLLLKTSSDKNYTVGTWLPESLFMQQAAKEQFVYAQHNVEIVVVAQSDKGCLDTAVYQLGVIPFDYGVFMPNAFSPNGDGLNDKIAPIFYMKRAYKINSFRIFDRWGGVVFSKGGMLHAEWDGTYANGENAAQGVYFYWLEVEFLDGMKRTFKGDIQLIR